MRLHLRKQRRITKDGTWTIQEIPRTEYEGILAWAENEGVIQPKRAEIENGDTFLFHERIFGESRYYKGSFIDQCPNQ